MNTRFLRFRGHSLLILTGIAMSGTILAQRTEKTSLGEFLEEIRVTAPRLVTKQVVGRTLAGSKVELITLERRVSYADLDLAVHADVTQLTTRVNEMAKEACADLAKMYPLSDPKTPDCVRAAVAAAKPQLDAAVAAADKHE
jgi:UrcA family protein